MRVLCGASELLWHILDRLKQARTLYKAYCGAVRRVTAGER